jgi:hypothetical protein
MLGTYKMLLHYHDVIYCKNDAMPMIDFFISYKYILALIFFARTDFLERSDEMFISSKTYE